MEKGLIIVIISIIVVVGLASMFLLKTSDEEIQQDTIQAQHTIDIEDFAFNQNELRIKVGETVKWTNHDSAKHTVTSDSGNELGSQLLSKDQPHTHTFNQAGTYSYHCTPHPYMKATIIVE